MMRSEVAAVCLPVFDDGLEGSMRRRTFQIINNQFKRITKNKTIKNERRGK